jgi:hypothetical protein
MSLGLVIAVVLIALISPTSTASTTPPIPSPPWWRPRCSRRVRRCCWRPSPTCSARCWGTAVAATIASGLIDAGVIDVGPQLLICALLAAIVWNLITWWLGLPSSSSHALVGSLVGAAVAASGNNFNSVIWAQGALVTGHGVIPKVIIPMVLSPLAGFIISFLLMGALYALLAWFANRTAGCTYSAARPFVNSFFGKAQIVSATAMGVAHGMNDAQKSMGIIALALAGATRRISSISCRMAGFPAHCREHRRRFAIPVWVKVVCALTMAAARPAVAGASSRRSATRWSSCIRSTASPRKPVRRGDPHRIDVRHSGVDHAQRVGVDHGRGRGQALQRDPLVGGRAHGVGVDPHPAVTALLAYGW